MQTKDFVHHSFKSRYACSYCNTAPEKKRQTLFWIREIFENRQNFGTFHTLVQELGLNERELVLNVSRDSRKVMFQK